jgi:molybdopterin-synthase adenylyltransferase
MLWVGPVKIAQLLTLKYSMNDLQLSRYSRHILLDELGIEGQQRLLNAHALIIGSGGLGSPVAMYLAASGVGRISVVDDDKVDLTNLQRQIAHTTEQVGQFKVDSIAKALRALNPDVRVNPIRQRVNAASLNQLVEQVDVVIDCCDNFATRQDVNGACVAHSKALVSGAATGFDGQLCVFDHRQTNSPCYACLFPSEQTPQEISCATMGVWAPLVGIIGSMQACEALKILAGVGTPLVGRLLMLSGLSMSMNEIKLAKNPQCSVCHVI